MIISPVRLSIFEYYSVPFYVVYALSKESFIINYVNDIQIYIYIYINIYIFINIVSNNIILLFNLFFVVLYGHI